MVTYDKTCRTANGADINAEPGVNPQRKDGRGNICPVTIILPTLAKEAENTFAIHNYTKNKTTFDRIEIFMNILDKKIDEAKDMLLERFNYICSQDPSSAKFMWENNTMSGYNEKEGIFGAMKHGTLVIGQLGLAEALQILIGKDHTTDEGMKLAKQIEELFSKNVKNIKKDINLILVFTTRPQRIYVILP